jgi:hypothetical protein
MKKNLRWKVILVVAVIALAVILAYPPGEKIHYGLDLQDPLRPGSAGRDAPGAPGHDR